MQIEAERVLAGGENPILANCPDETRDALLKMGSLRAFGHDELLFQEHGPAGVVLLLLDGSLQMSKTATRGRRQVICSFAPSACGGVCMLAVGDHSLADVKGLEEGHVLVLDRESFQSVTKTDVMLCQAGWDSVAQCMGHLSTLVEHLSFNKVAERVVMTLLDSTEKDGDLVRWTQAELAAEVGTTREVVARCLAGLQMAGAVRLGRARITVLSREKLQRQI